MLAGRQALPGPARVVLATPHRARQPGAAALERCDCLTGTLSAAIPVPLALLSLGAGIVAVALAALIDAMIRARRLGRQRALRDVAAVSWQQFEEVIADAFRRHGHRVREVGGRGTADGGVDLVLIRDDETTVVQAKHWRRDRVGVALVRELYGAQTARRADHAMFVTSMGRYTADAVQFAA